MGFADAITRGDRAARRLLGGVSVVYHPTAGAPVTVTGIFAEPFLLVQGDAEAGVEARTPSVFFELADLPSDPMVDDPTLTIRGNLYRIHERRPADFGSVVLFLRKVV